MKSNRSPRGYWLFVLLATALITSTLIPASTTAQSNSQVRIVRLSFVEGTVTMYRPDADEWAKAFVNTPIQQGFKLATDANSFAEVEFENGSAARMGQSSEIDFTSLSLSPEGNKINRLTLARGYATFAVTPESGDVYQISAAGSTYAVTDTTMFRVDVEPGGQRLEVFRGDVAVQGPYGSGKIARKHVLEVTPGAADPFQITKGIKEDAWDKWVDKRQQTATLASNKAGPGNGSLYAGSSLYGWNDLSYFGSWNYLTGFGSCWSPMMGAGWAPYSIGRWSWYPGLGYTWISGLPWGWLPFHFGSWIYPAGLGWCWLPGNFSMWSPGLVTWYQGPGWVRWAPRPFRGHSNRPLRCPGGQNCSTAVSVNTFQAGRPISPNDVITVNPFHGRAVASPTVPLTRSLRLPGPAVDGYPLAARGGAAGRSGFHFRRRRAAPTRVFSQGTVSGAWNVRPHAPAVFDQQTRRFVNRSGPAFPVHGNGMRSGRSKINNDMRIRNRQERQMLRREQRMENARARRQMRQMNRRSGMSQQRMNRSSSSGRSSGGFGRSQSMGRSSGQMGAGMRSGGGMRSSGGGMGGGMRSSGSGMGGGARGPHH